MARIRTIKPDFFRHSGLFRAEREAGLPLRVAFAGLWTAADREGRFKWKPDELKLDCLPFDEVDFSRVLDALRTRGHIVKYTVAGVEYGCIPSWKDHQIINNKETRSILPSPEESSEESNTCTREARDEHASQSRLFLTQGEGKGKEGEGKGKEIPPNATRPTAPLTTPAPVPSAEAKKPAKAPAPTAALWQAYADGYYSRYGCPPVRNGKVNGQLARVLERLGADEAPLIAAFYVASDNPYYVREMHAVDHLLRDAEKLRTLWATGRSEGAPRASRSAGIDVDARNAEARRLLGFDTQETVDG